MTSADLGQQLEGYVARLVETGRYRSLCIARLSLPPLPYAKVSGFLASERTLSSERCLGVSSISSQGY
ncbi:hypothetical protein [Paraburkholderia sp.]|uniref:hypothetical protein n=1 Tax=Paraburkholderia sp. TaxID=1926495 RepID=UPI002D40DAB1|nr:hypothetical protein [Paraburkholderia sp.]HZZ04088.1 hypothetical protein [Paraburkholderia sp.]